MEGLNDFDSLLQSAPEFAELASMLEEAKKEIIEETQSAMWKLAVDVEASADLNNSSLDYQALYGKIDWFINNRENEEKWDEYICCILSDMIQKDSLLNRELFRKNKEWNNFLTPEDESILSGIECWRTQYLTENIKDPIKRDKIKNLIKKLVKRYKETV